MFNKQQEQQNKIRIRRIKTEHDESANIDKRKLFLQTKALQESNIDYAVFADNITDQLFPLKPLEIGFVQSYTLKDDPKFKQIRHLLQKYNQDVRKYNEKSEIGLHLKTVVMDCMLKFMRLMMQAPDANAKKKILDVAYYWFKKNVDKKGNSSPTKRRKQALQAQVKNLLLQSKLLPKATIEKELPSTILAEQLHNYKIRARTNYTQIDAPKVELENYITHKLGFVNQKNQELEAEKLKSDQQKRQEKWKNRVLFKKPYIQTNQAVDLQDEMLPQNQTDAILLMEKEQNEIFQKQIGPDGQEIIPQQQIGPDGKPVNVQQGLEDQNQDTFGVPADEPDEPDNQVAEQEPENKKVGKLDPLVKIFLMDREKRSKTVGEVSADNRLQFKKNYQLDKHRQEQFDGNAIREWASNKSKFKSQLSRKIQSIRNSNHLSMVKKDLSMHEFPTRVEHTIKKARLNQTLKQYKNYLNHQPTAASEMTETDRPETGKPESDKAETEPSLSLFSRQRIKSEGLKTFSSVLEDRKRLDQKDSYLDEIQDLKRNFAKYKLYTPLDSFKKAVVHPQQKPCVWSELDKQTREGVQLPRCNMISNPFIKAAKKKKKKGKKKK